MWCDDEGRMCICIYAHSVCVHMLIHTYTRARAHTHTHTHTHRQPHTQTLSLSLSLSLSLFLCRSVSHTHKHTLQFRWDCADLNCWRVALGIGTIAQCHPSIICDLDGRVERMNTGWIGKRTQQTFAISFYWVSWNTFLFGEIVHRSRNHVGFSIPRCLSPSLPTSLSCSCTPSITSENAQCHSQPITWWNWDIDNL